VAAADVGEKAAARRFDQIEHGIEPTLVIRVRDVALPDFRREIEEHVQPVLSVARAHRRQIAIVAGIHSEHVVETFEIIGFRLPRPEVADVDTALARRPLRPPVGRLPDVPGPGTGGISADVACQSFRLDEAAKHPFGRW